MRSSRHADCWSRSSRIPPDPGHFRPQVSIPVDMTGQKKTIQPVAASRSCTRASRIGAATWRLWSPDRPRSRATRPAPAGPAHTRPTPRASHWSPTRPGAGYAGDGRSSAARARSDRPRRRRRRAHPARPAGGRSPAASDRPAPGTPPPSAPAPSPQGRRRGGNLATASQTRSHAHGRSLAEI